MASLDGGMNLMNVSMFWQLIVKGLVLIVAALLDASKGKVREGRKIPFLFVPGKCSGIILLR